MTNLWKVNWAETKQHFIDWWNHEGLVLGSWGTGIQSNSLPHAHIMQPESPATVEQHHTDPDFVAQNIRYEMAHKTWPADILPVAWPDIGTVSLCTYLGAIPEYTATNVWYTPCIHDPDSHPSLIFDPECSYCKMLESVVKVTVRQSQGNYFIGCPALVPNLDVLAELRGTERLLTDLIDRPQWVHEKLQEIDLAYVQAVDRMYELIKLEDGSMAFGYFMLWGPGKTGLLQCDVVAMISPRMFKKFVVPYLREECRYLDYSLFHVDGHQCLRHIDHLLEIEKLDAVEWTPDPKVPPGGSPHWYDLYRKILEAGKSVWVANLQADEVLPLLDAIGGKGVYLNVIDFKGETEVEKLVKAIEPYR
jgi:hypothetical protein